MRKYKLWIISAIILMIINIGASLVWSDQFSNVFTSISGWVSGIATIVLGLIALHQNKIYKIENDKNLKKKYDLSVFKNLTSLRTEFVKDMKIKLDNFIEKFHFQKISGWLAEIEVSKNNGIEGNNSLEMAVKIEDFKQELAIHMNFICQSINDDWAYNTINKNLVDSIKAYYLNIVKYVNGINYNKPLGHYIEQYNKETYVLFYKVLELSNKYIKSIELDINDILTKENVDIDTLKKHYKHISIK